MRSARSRTRMTWRRPNRDGRVMYCKLKNYRFSRGFLVLVAQLIAQENMKSQEKLCKHVNEED